MILDNLNVVGRKLLGRKSCLRGLVAATVEFLRARRDSSVMEDLLLDHCQTGRSNRLDAQGLPWWYTRFGKHYSYC